ncbi:MAG: radical SAM protein [Myxococcales bacterium]|nr:radical SAM protein [Myxococcales bacterium]
MANLGYLQLTRECKQACRFCSNPPSGVELSDAEMRESIDDLVARGYDGVILTGGEPTIAPLLLPAVHHAHAHGLFIRMITNGQRVCDRPFLAALVEAGLTHLHLSLHSSRPLVHDFVTQTAGSHENIDRALFHVADLGITADINTVINAYNSDHLDETVTWIIERHPHVRHFVWNNMDPNMNRAERNPDVIPRLGEFELSLRRAMRHIARTGRSFRAERVPLCYMPEFAHCSTETRKIVKEEERCIRFLDKKGFVLQKQFLHGKSPACDACALDPVCAGLYSMNYHYDPAELFPVPGDPVQVMRAVLRREPEPELVERILARRGLRSDEQPDDHGLRSPGGASVSAAHAESARIVRGAR